MIPPAYEDATVTVYLGGCMDVLPQIPDNSVDAVVTDPPYGLEFMGKEWDSFKATGSSGLMHSPKDEAREFTNASGHMWDNTKALPRFPGAGKPFQQWCELWATECLRVLKPGGHMLAFGGTRTWHRLACAIEDAGFEVRDSIAWMYGSGFPKSLDVSKAIDKARDDRADVLGVTSELARLRDVAGLTNRDLDAVFGFAGMAGHWTSVKSQPAVPTVEQWARLRDLIPGAHELDAEVWRLNGRKGKPGDNFEAREVLSSRQVADIRNGHGRDYGGAMFAGEETGKIEHRETAPATDAARQWQGWGTALKPAHEPIVVARKPLIGTVAANVLTHGTGALNIDGCRIEGEERKPVTGFKNKSLLNRVAQANDRPWMLAADPEESGAVQPHAAGRWPANVILDEHQANALDQQSGELTSGNRTAGTYAGLGYMGSESAEFPDITGDTGGASRFFYTAKASADERVKVDGIAHPTVKPLSLMRWLVRLVTPPGGLILDPFAGSGTTAEAALLEHFRTIAIEREPSYLPNILQRIHRRRDPIAALRQTPQEDQGLFALLDPRDRYCQLCGDALDPDDTEEVHPHCMEGKRTQPHEPPLGPH